MQAEDLLREGRLNEALAQLQSEVRSRPAEPKLRVFLFQLLAVMGDWKRALTQLNVAADLNSADNALMARVYRQAIALESHRRGVFAGRNTPLVFGEPPPWLGLMVQANQLLGQGHVAEAAELRAQALEEAPAIEGAVNGDAFAWIADADVRLGPVLEAFVDGKYYWVPFMRVAKLYVEPPTDLRDMVWAPTHFTWSNGGETFGFIPTRYVDSEASEDELIRLARKTTWVDRGHEAFIGSGQRMLVTDAAEFSLLEVRDLVLGQTESQASPAATGQA